MFFVNGIQNSSSNFDATRAYETLFSSTRIKHDDRGHIITLEMFTKYFYLLDFFMTNDTEADEEHIILTRLGNMRTEARFKNRCLNI